MDLMIGTERVQSKRRRNAVAVDQLSSTRVKVVRDVPVRPTTGQFSDVRECRAMLLFALSTRFGNWFPLLVTR
jgi:hypothetical protein